MQGTIGISVSFAGALVAIRLANISTQIIEKEKYREDSKMYFDVISESLSPYRSLVNCVNDLYLQSANLSDQIKSSVVKQDDTVNINDLCESITTTATTHLKDMIASLQEIQNNTFFYALWLMITDKRFKNSDLIASGGVRSSGDFRQSKSYLVEDLSTLIILLQSALKKLEGVKLTHNDLKLFNRLARSVEALGKSMGYQPNEKKPS